MMLRLTGIDITMCRRCGRVTAAADPHSRSAAPDGDASDEDQTTMTMRQSRSRPDMQLADHRATAALALLSSRAPEKHLRVPLLRRENLFRADFRSGLASTACNQPDRFDLIDSHH